MDYEINIKRRCFDQMDVVLRWTKIIKVWTSWNRDEKYIEVLEDVRWRNSVGRSVRWCT